MTLLLDAVFLLFFLFDEWLLGVVVKARLILLTASDFRRGDGQVGCSCKDKNWKKMFKDQFLQINYLKRTIIAVKKCEESEKNGLEHL